jgi:hypothetical protein
MGLRVLATNPDRSVAVIVPSDRCVRVLATGGGLPLWCAGRQSLIVFMRDTLQRGPHDIDAILARNLVPLDVARAWEIYKLAACPEWHSDRTEAQRFDLARRWVDGLIYGGYGDRAAVTLIGEFSRAPGQTALEVVDVAEVPSDRTHRNAWRRSFNGGPIVIDEAAALAIDEARMWAQHEGDAR